MRSVLTGLVLSVCILVALPIIALGQGTTKNASIEARGADGAPTAGALLEIYINNGKNAVGTTGTDGTADLDYAAAPIADGTRVQVLYRDCDGEIRIVFVAPGEEIDEDCDDTLLGFIIWGRTGRITVTTGPGGPTMTAVDARPWWKPRFAFGGGPTVDTFSEAEDNACADNVPGIELDSCSLDATGAGFSLFGEVGPVSWARVGFLFQQLHESKLEQRATFSDAPAVTGESSGFFDASMVGPYVIGIAPLRYVQPWVKVLFLYLSEESGSDIRFIDDVSGEVLDSESSRQETNGWNVLPAVGADIHIAPWISFRAGFEWGTLETDAENENEEAVDEEFRKGIFSIVIHPPM